MPALSVVCSLGLVLVVIADNAARDSANWAELPFWAGLLVIFIPIAVRLASSRPGRGERIWLNVVLAFGLYLVKIMHSPLQFTLTDELQHLRTATDAIQGGRLFQENPIHPVGALFPGMEGATSALASVGGLSVFTSGLILIGVARLVLVLALFHCYELASDSARIAGVATMLYLANPYFLFFDAQFSYESLALPLAALALWAAVRRRTETGLRLNITLLLLPGLAAVVVTHHLTSYALIGFLSIGAAVDLMRSMAPRIMKRRARNAARSLDAPRSAPAPVSVATARNIETERIGWPVLFILAMCLAWLVYVATSTLAYLAQPVTQATREVLQVVAGEAMGRQLFRTPVGEVSPLWERLAVYLTVFLILIGLPFGLVQIWRRMRSSILALSLAIASLAYPLSNALRFSESGIQVSGRMSEFLFIAVAFVLGVGAVDNRVRHRLAAAQPLALSLWVAAMVVGGVILGWPRAERLPGPYLVAAYSRSVEPQSLAVAEWARSYLGSGNRLIADLSNRNMLGSYGQQRPVTRFVDEIDTAAVLLSPVIGPEEVSALRQGRIRYVVVDRRLSTDLPRAGYYVEEGEPGQAERTTPPDPAILSKFDGRRRTSRLLDSGDINLYDVEREYRAP